MCAEWYHPDLEPDEEAALLRLLESRLEKSGLASVPEDIVDRCRILSRIPVTEDEMKGVPHSLWKKLEPLEHRLQKRGDVDRDSPEWRRSPEELEWDDYSPDAWTDACERWTLALCQCLEGHRRGDLQALIELSKAVAYAADCYELSSAPLHTFARRLESYTIGLRRIEDFVTEVGPSEELAAARVVVDQVRNRAFQEVADPLRRAEVIAGSDDPEEAPHAQGTSDVADLQTCANEESNSSAARAGVSPEPSLSANTPLESNAPDRVEVDYRSDNEIRVRRILTGKTVDEAAIRGSSLAKLFRLVAEKPGEYQTWNDLTALWIQDAEWKGKILTENTLRDYGRRVRRTLENKGLSQYWRYSSTEVAWWPPE